MWALGTWVLLGAVCAGSAQLQFNVTKSVEQTACNKTVILPCIVTNLIKNNIQVIFVKWKLEKKAFFIFEGSTGKINRNESFSSAELESLQNLTSGIASLTISKTQAVPGNYSCEVTESSREGETVIELIYHRVPWFTPVENILIILSMVLAILFYWIQLAVTVSKFETALLKIGLFIAGVVITISAVVGFSLLISDDFKPENQIGLGLIVLPAVILVPCQYFLLQIVYENNLSFAIGVVILESLGYLIAVIGFGLCITGSFSKGKTDYRGERVNLTIHYDPDLANTYMLNFMYLSCRPKNGAVVIAGLAIMALIALVGLIYAILSGYSKKEQPPRKAVEEPLNAKVTGESDRICYRGGDM